MRRLVPSLAVAVLAVALVALLVFGVLQTADDTSIDQAVARGEHPTAPDTTLPLLDGSGSRALADHRGRWVVVNFFASWCHPCENEAPLLNRLQRRLGDRGSVVGVAYNDLTEDARGFVRDYEIAFPVVRDVEDDLGDAYGVTGLPETFVVDPTGRIVALKRSEITREWVSEVLDPLLAERQRAG